MLPATDIEGRLDALGEKAAAGGFQSEYDFQLDLFQVFTSAHDGHFGYRGDVFKAFSFRNSLASDIISISIDGKAVPKLYHLGQLQNPPRAHERWSLTYIFSRPGEQCNRFRHYQDQRPRCRDPHQRAYSQV